MYQELYRWENLTTAFRKAAKGKRGRPDVAAFEYHLEENLLELQEDLQTKSYIPGVYRSFYIHEPKRRLISAAPFRDRVVHHALCNLIEPIFERSFTGDTYANRVGKGTHRALDRAQRYARRYRYVLQCDLEQFFPSIDHQILQELLRKKVTDEDVLHLIGLILRSGEGVLSENYRMIWFPEDNLFDIFRPRGLPIGNLTSQFWANCYLNPFDHFVKRTLGCQGYIRYVDDFLLFGDHKDLLWKWKEKLIQYLTSLRLTIHPGSHPRPVLEGIPFLGFILYPHRKRLKRRKGLYYQRRLNYLIMLYQAGKIDLAQLTASVQGWVNHLRYANTVGLRKKIMGSRVIPAQRRAR